MPPPVRSHASFDALSRSRDRGKAGPIWIARAAGPGDGARVSYAIGRAVGNAVVRNRLRRQLRSIMTELDRAGALTVSDHLVGVRAEAVELRFSELRQRVQDALGRLS